MNRVVVVLKSGGDFNFEDVRLIHHHVRKNWTSPEPLEFVCFWDKADQPYDLGGIKLMPIPGDDPGTWARLFLYSPELEHLRPFLYLDLDTAVLGSVEQLFKAVPNPDAFITLEDLWQPGRLATGVVWFPGNNNPKIAAVWNRRNNAMKGWRMDYYIREVTSADYYWQKLTDCVADFKPKGIPVKYLQDVKPHQKIVCFHGKPRIPEAVSIPWVKKYVDDL